MSKIISWKIAGPAGYGIMTAGSIFARLCTRYGWHVFTESEYPSLIRGGHNVLQVRFSDSEIYSHSEDIDILIALNQEAINQHSKEINPGGALICDEELDYSKISKKVHVYPVPLKKIAAKHGFTKIMMNSVALGATVAILGIDMKNLLDLIDFNFKKKSEEIKNNNKKAASEGFNFVSENLKFCHKLKKIKHNKKRIILNGNAAVALGAVKAGMKFMSAYPMTPATSIMQSIAAWGRDNNIVMKQTGDEIAAITMALGAFFSGVRAMTATSGGGFSLMVEALGLAAQSETPIVVVVSQRPGPSTGLPTRTDQGDAKFILNASQGEFPRIVITPGDVDECFYLTYEAFNLAEKFQLPVIIILDKFLSNSEKSTYWFDTTKLKIERGSILNEKEISNLNEKEFKRYRLTKNGVSPRTIPGTKKGMFTATGNVHDEASVVCEDQLNKIKMTKKLFNKFETAKKSIKQPKLKGSNNASVTLFCWGSVKCQVKEAVRILKEQGINVNYYHLTYLSPFPKKEIIKIIRSAKNILLVENNYTGQLGSLIRHHTCYDPKHKLLKYDGRPITPEEIVKKIKEDVLDGKY